MEYQELPQDIKDFMKTKYDENTLQKIREKAKYKTPDFKNLKKIESEKEYYEQLKKYKKAINKLYRKSFMFLRDPPLFFVEFENLMGEMVFIGLVTEEYAQQQRERLFKELNQPEEFKEWIEYKKKRLLSVLKRKKSKK